MKKFVKSLAVITAIFLASGGFIACSDDDDSSTPAQEQGSGEQESKTSVTDLKAAPLVHHGTSEITEGLYKDYSCSAYYKNADPSKIFVTLTATDLIRHTNGQQGGVTAYWVGIAIPNSGTALKARTYFEGATDTDKGSFGDAGIEWTGGNVTYNTFYFGSYDGSFAKKGIVEISNDGTNVAKTYEITFAVTPKQIIFAKISHTAQEIVDFYKESAKNAKSGWNSYYFSLGNTVTYVDNTAEKAGTNADGDDYYTSVSTVATTENTIESTLKGKKILFGDGNCETYKKNPWPLIFVDKGALLAGADKTANNIYDMKNIKVYYKINDTVEWTPTTCNTLKGCNNAITRYFASSADNGILIPALKNSDKIQLKLELYDSDQEDSHKIAEVTTDPYTAVTTINLEHSN